MATQTRSPTSEISVTGTWSGTSRHLLLDDHPDSGNPIADGTTCSAAGVAVFGFSAFSVPTGATSLSVQVLYYDFKNGSQSAANGALIRCNDTTNQLAGSHNPGNGNANIALRTVDYATNPKSAAAWTVDDVNGVGTNGLTAFGISVTDANPTSTISSALLQVTYTPPSTGTLNLNLGAITISAAGHAEATGALSKNLGAITISATGTVADPPVTSTGTLDIDLGAITISATGRAEASGALSANLGAITIAATGRAEATGALSKNLGAITITAEGTVADPPIGGGARRLVISPSFHRSWAG